VELRLWTGYLSESDYFDSDTSNDHSMIHGFSFAYAPSFLPGLTVSANRVCLAKWRLENLRYIVPDDENTYIGEPGKGEDQRMSLGMDWRFPQVGFRAYGEIGLDDYSAAKLIYPFHTVTYTVGFEKATKLPFHGLWGKLTFEWNNTEMSQDQQYQWPYSFGFHYQMTQGYTNRGQWLGSGIGYGGNCQYVSYTVYHEQGSVGLFFNRVNPDNNFMFKDTIHTTSSWDSDQDKLKSFKTVFTLGLDAECFITEDFLVQCGLAVCAVKNPLYAQSTGNETNLRAVLSARYSL
jgi:hypothetical protein